MKKTDADRQTMARQTMAADAEFLKMRLNAAGEPATHVLIDRRMAQRLAEILEGLAK